VRTQGKAEALQVLLTGCESSLTAIENIVSSCNSLGTDDKKLTDKLRLGLSDLPAAQLRITVHIGALNTFMASINSTGLAKVITQLKKLSLRKKPSVMSLTSESSSRTEVDANWQAFKADMSREGVLDEDLNGKRDFVIAYVTGMTTKTESTYLSPRESFLNPKRLAPVEDVGQVKHATKDESSTENKNTDNNKTGRKTNNGPMDLSTRSSVRRHKYQGSGLKPQSRPTYPNFANIYQEATIMEEPEPPGTDTDMDKHGKYHENIRDLYKDKFDELLRDFESALQTPERQNANTSKRRSSGERTTDIPGLRKENDQLRDKVLALNTRVAVLRADLRREKSQKRSIAILDKEARRLRDELNLKKQQCQNLEEENDFILKELQEYQSIPWKRQLVERSKNLA
jgi:hypothetical protein